MPLRHRLVFIRGWTEMMMVDILTGESWVALHLHILGDFFDGCNVIECAPRRVIVAYNELLFKQVTFREICATFFQVNPSKTPRSDSMPSLFVFKNISPLSLIRLFIVLNISCVMALLFLGLILAILFIGKNG